MSSASYLRISPSVAYTVLNEILGSSGILIDEPDRRKIEQILASSKMPTVPMVSIPQENILVHIKQEIYRENGQISPSPTGPSLSDHNCEQAPNVLATSCSTNESEGTQPEYCDVSGDDSTGLAFLKSTLSLSMMEAEYLRNQLYMLNLKSRPILELFKYCRGSKEYFCRCPDIPQRIYEMGILVQRK